MKGARNSFEDQRHPHKRRVLEGMRQPHARHSHTRHPLRISDIPLKVNTSIHPPEGTVHHLKGTRHSLEVTIHLLEGIIHPMRVPFTDLEGTIHPLQGTRHPLKGSIPVTSSGTDYCLIFWVQGAELLSSLSVFHPTLQSVTFHYARKKPRNFTSSHQHAVKPVNQNVRRGNLGTVCSLVLTGSGSNLNTEKCLLQHLDIFFATNARN